LLVLLGIGGRRLARHQHVAPNASRLKNVPRARQATIKRPVERGLEAREVAEPHSTADRQGAPLDLVHLTRFETAFDRRFIGRWSRARDVLQPRAFGRDVLVAASRRPPMPRRTSNARRSRKFIAAFPISAESQAQLLSLYMASMIRFPENRFDEKKAILKRTSYRDYLTKLCGLSREAATACKGRTLDFFDSGRIRAGLRRARSRLSRLCRLEAAGRHQRGLDEPYIYHFPTETLRSRGCWCVRLFQTLHLPHYGRCGGGVVRLRKA